MAELIVQPPLARLLTRQRLVLWAGLIAVVVTSWIYLAWLAQDMSSMAHHAGHTGPVGHGGAMAMHGMGALWTLVMWLVMIGAMMLPTAAPMIILHARFQSGQDSSRSPTPHSTLFAAGYVVAWTFYAGIAAAIHVGLETVALMSPMAMKLTSGPIAAAVLIVAGVFQLTPIKDACLTRCRTPIAFFMNQWREGPDGAFSMGVRNGLYCVACCWALMAVMFVVGAMNLLWIGALTLVMLLEKVTPHGKLFSWALGVGLIAAGAWVALGSPTPT